MDLIVDKKILEKYLLLRTQLTHRDTKDNKENRNENKK